VDTGAGRAPLTGRSVAVSVVGTDVRDARSGEDFRIAGTDGPAPEQTEYLMNELVIASLAAANRDDLLAQARESRVVALLRAARRADAPRVSRGVGIRRWRPQLRHV
jgi:hypothetical protein